MGCAFSFRDMLPKSVVRDRDRGCGRVPKPGWACAGRGLGLVDHVPLGCVAKINIP